MLASVSQSVDSLRVRHFRPNRSSFFIVQGVVWLVFAALSSVPGTYHATRAGYSYLDAALGVLAIGLGAAVSSSLLEALYARLPEKLLGSRCAIPTIAVSCLAISIVWSVTEIAVFTTLNIENMFRPVDVSTAMRFAFTVMRGTVFLVGWSAVYIAIIYSRQARAASERAAEVARLAKDAQLALLRSQLHPHFLFNSLNSIIALIDENPSRAEEMVRDLAVLLRQSLDSHRSGAGTVRDEFKFIERYVRCEKARFEERLRVKYDFEDAVMSQLLPSMLLHPLVENAIKHGQRKDDVALELEISGRLDGKRIVLEVRNTGALSKKDTRRVRGPGIGLNNVKQRLAALFPHDHAFELRDGDGWVTATLQFAPRETVT